MATLFQKRDTVLYTVYYSHKAEPENSKRMRISKASSSIIWRIVGYSTAYDAGAGFAYALTL